MQEESKDITEKTHKKLNARELDLGYKLLLESLEPEILQEIQRFEDINYKIEEN